MSYNYDPELAAGLDFLPEGGLDLANPEDTRAAFLELVGQLNAGIDQSGVQTENLEIPGLNEAPAVPVRLYRPENTNTTEATPALLHIHGGGFVVGNLDSELGSCINLCRSLGILVVSVDYRLAPETPFPGGLEDCYAALQWVHDNSRELNIDPARVAVLGMSAGGGLSAALSLMARDKGGPAISFQYLGIPELDDRLATVSMTNFTDTPMWSRPSAELSWDAYLGDSWQRGGQDVPYLAAPARADDLSGLPPAYVSTMEFDPLRDEGIEYGLKLLQAGVSAELHSFPGTFHGSSLFTHAEVSQREAKEQLAVLKRALHLNN